MKLINDMLGKLNINYVILNSKGKVLLSNVDDSKLILDIVNCKSKENDMIKYDNKYYNVGYSKFQDNSIYFAQDVTKMVNQYQSLKKDELTKLYIRGIALPMLDDYIIKSCSLNESFSIIMGDIDFFKNINDSYGHDAGDQVLKNVSMKLLNSFRTRNYGNLDKNKRVVKNCNPDIICRYGGEEFLIILKNIDLKTTIKRLEMVRKSIEDEGTITMSYGIYNFNPNDIDYEIDENNVQSIRQNLIKFADECLYYSKNHGRNMISYMDSSTNQIMSMKKEDLHQKKLTK